MGLPDRLVRGRLDDGTAVSVQDPPLRRRWPPGLGHQLPPGRPLEERNLLPDPTPGRPRHLVDHQGEFLRHPGRPRGAAQLPDHRSEAVPHRRCRGDADGGRPLRAGVRFRLRSRRQGRNHQRAHRRSDLEHRLRAGRGGRPADQPDPVQPLLSRKAGVLSGRAGTLRLRDLGADAARLGPAIRSAEQRPAPLLQPPDRDRREPARAHPRRRPGDGEARRLRGRGARHAVRREHRRGRRKPTSR